MSGVTDSLLLLIGAFKITTLESLVSAAVFSSMTTASRAVSGCLSALTGRRRITLVVGSSLPVVESLDLDSAGSPLPTIDSEFNVELGSALRAFATPLCVQAPSVFSSDANWFEPFLGFGTTTGLETFSEVCGGVQTALGGVVWSELAARGGFGGAIWLVFVVSVSVKRSQNQGRLAI